MSPTVYAGNTPGQFQVDANGCATYSIPIVVPPGTSGIAPSLSLEYSSGGSPHDCVVGLGWALRGLSSIGRCGATVAQDGFIRAVAFDDQDRFILDGIRLQPVQGQYGAKDAVYHTEVETWKRIEPVFASSTAGRTGPDGFRVLEKGGRILEFGTTPDSQVPASDTNPTIRVWALSKVSDRNGNSMTIQYSIDAPNSAFYPTRIAYTANADMQPLRLVELLYESRPDCIPHFQGGYRVAYTRRLSTIRTSVQNIPVKAYLLNYQQGSSTGRSQLASVTESDGAGNALPPSSFGWQDGNPGVFATATPQPVTELQQGGAWIPADVNGDGLIDIVYASAGSGGALQLSLLINTGAGFVASSPLTLNELSYGGALLPMDMSADGLMRIVYGAQGSDQQGNPQLGLTVFTAVADKTSPSGYSLSAGPINGAGPNGLPPGGGLLSMDVNGDGLVDLVYSQAYDGAHLGLTTLLSNGTGFSLAGTLTTGLAAGGQGLALDMNGDGMSDLVYAYADSYELKFALFRAVWGQGLVLDTNSPVQVPVPLTAGGALLPFDANSDGLGDFVYATQASDGESLQLFTFISNGVSFELQNGGSPQTYPIQFGGNLLPMDVNGDGLCELVLSNRNGTGINLSVLAFTGSGFTIINAPVNQSLSNYTWGGSFVPLDLQGLGRTGMVYAYGVSGINFAVVPPSGVYPDLVSTITNGLGATFSITHKPLTDPSVYSRTDSPSSQLDAQGLLGNLVSGSSFALVASGALTPGSPGATFASRTVDFPKYVAAGHVVSDGRGDNYQFKHFYRGAKVDLGGRGWLGFSSVLSTDVMAGCATETAYSQVFPTTYLSVSARLTSAAGELYRETVNVFESNSLASWPNSAVRQPQMKSATTRYYTPGVADADRQDQQIYAYDDFGNRTLTSEQGTGLSVPLFTLETFDNRADSWLLGLKIETRQCADAAGTQLLSWQKMEYDQLGRPINNLVWDDQSKVWLSTVVAYDNYGNAISHTTPSQGVTDFTFDPVFHTFCILTTAPPNASGIRLQTQTEFDPGFGVKTREIDANGVAREFRVDPLGRVSETLGPNAAGDLVSLTTHAWVQSQGTYYEEIRTRLDWLGTQWGWSRNYLDGLSRSYRAETISANGSGAAVTEKTYDSRGLVLTSSLPYLPTDQAPVYMSYTYDPLGRTVRTVLPGGNNQSIVTETTWVGTDHVIETQGVGTPAPRVAHIEFGGFGEKQFVRKRTAPDGGVTLFEYDAMRHLLRVTDPIGIVTDSKYDSQERIIHSSVSGNGKVYRSENFSFDDLQQTSSVTDALGNVKTTTRDALGRVLVRTVTGADGSSYSVANTYDAGASFSLGRLSSVSRSDGLFAYSFSYDAAGNQTETTLHLEGAAYTSQSTFIPTAKVDQVTLPDGSIHHCEYFAGGELSAISLHQDDALLASAAFTDYNAQQVPATVSYGNGVIEKNSYDPSGRLIRQRAIARDGRDCIDVDVSRDVFDQISALTDRLTDGGTQTFTYDVTGRLAGASGPYGTEVYQFDLGGNILEKGGVLFQYDGQQVTAGSTGGETVFSASYDAMGKMTRRVLAGNEQLFQYDPEERLLSDGSSSFVYDHKGSRLSKTTVDGPVTFYISPYFEVTLFPNGARQHTRYLSGLFGVAASSTVLDSGIQPPNIPGVPRLGIEYLHSDHLGSTRLATNADGAMEASAVYEPFGVAHLEEAQDSFREKFTGQELDPSGLYYFQARYYDPFTGRFISSDDRTGASPFVCDAFNRYAYVLNDPLSHTDPSGHSIWDLVGQLIVSAVTVAVGAVITPFSGALGGALIGAGISGAVFAGQMLMSHQWDTGSSTQQWNAFGIQFGIGAATGLVTGGIGRIGSRVLSEVPDVVATSRWAGIYQTVGVDAARTSLAAAGSGTRIAVSMGFGALAGGSGGVLQQVMQNAAHNANPLGQPGLDHYDLTRGVGLAFLLGVGFGAMSGAASRSVIERNNAGGRVRFSDLEREVFGEPGARARAGAVAGAAVAPRTGWDTAGYYLKVGFSYSLKSSFLAGGRVVMYFISPNWPHQNW